MGEQRRPTGDKNDPLDFQGIVRLTIEDYQAMVKECAAENAALREIVRALCEDVEGKLPAGVADYDTHRYCIYCDADNVYELSDHAPDCPIVRGRQALAKGGLVTSTEPPKITGVIPDVSAGEHTLTFGADGATLDGEQVDVEPADDGEARDGE